MNEKKSFFSRLKGAVNYGLVQISIIFSRKIDAFRGEHRTLRVFGETPRIVGAHKSYENAARTIRFYLVALIMRESAPSSVISYFESAKKRRPTVSTPPPLYFIRGRCVQSSSRVGHLPPPPARTRGNTTTSERRVYFACLFKCLKRV